VGPIARLGRPAPDFALRDLAGRTRRLEDGRGKIVVLNFWSAECPWTERSDPAVLQAVRESGDGVWYWPIAANAGEEGAQIEAAAGERGLPVVLLDPDQSVADEYGAQTTPHVFVVDREGILRYAGAPDDASFRQRDPTRSYLREALSALLAGHLPEVQETPGRGCALVRFSNIE